MKLKIFYPNYDNSISGIPNAILHHYGFKTETRGLPPLDKALSRHPKNVIFLILDGMGIDMLEHNLSRFSFLRRHIKTQISSVFPPTTVAATTTFYSGQSPVEHGWLGWSPYFKDLNCVVEIFTNKNYYTGKPVSENVSEKIPYVHIFDKIKSADTNVHLTEIFPSFIKPNGASDFDDMCSKIKEQSTHDGPQFILAYWPNPDSSSHEFGPYSKEVKTVLKNLNAKVKHLCTELTDSLVIISADHGHVENKGDIFINNYPDLLDCLQLPLSLDCRVQAVFLKENREDMFLALFEKYLSKEFLLFKTEDALKMHLFGYGKPHPLAKDFLGDYLIISKAQKSLIQRFENDAYIHLTGAHSGLTNQEMLVPLILVEKA